MMKYVILMKNKGGFSLYISVFQVNPQDESVKELMCQNVAPKCPRLELTCPVYRADPSRCCATCKGKPGQIFVVSPKEARPFFRLPAV